MQCIVAQERIGQQEMTELCCSVGIGEQVKSLHSSKWLRSHCIWSLIKETDRFIEYCEVFRSVERTARHPNAGSVVYGKDFD